MNMGLGTGVLSIYNAFREALGGLGCVGISPQSEQASGEDQIKEQEAILKGSI